MTTDPFAKFFSDQKRLQEYLKKSGLDFAKSQSTINQHLERLGFNPARVKALLESNSLASAVPRSLPQVSRNETAPSKAKRRRTMRRWKASTGTKAAARRMERFIEEKCEGNINEFARRAGTTDKTIRHFRKTGRVKRSIFSDIARAMGITPEELLAR